MAPALNLKLGLVGTLERPSGGEKFLLPAWACSPQSGAALHVVKDGETLSTLKLDCGKKYYMFGRAPKTCAQGRGYMIKHETLSRQHAVILHGENDTLYIIDLDSPHGTWVNDRKIPPYEPVLLENGRILRFGESTRRYVVRIFPREDRLVGSKGLALSFKRLAGLTVSTRGDADEEDDEDEDEEEDDDVDNVCNKDGAGRAPSPCSKEELRRRTKQARLFSGLNAAVSYPSPRSLLKRSPSDSPTVSPSLSATDLAAALAATASPTASPHARSPASKARQRTTLMLQQIQRDHAAGQLPRTEPARDRAARAQAERRRKPAKDDARDTKMELDCAKQLPPPLPPPPPLLSGGLGPGAVVSSTRVRSLSTSCSPSEMLPRHLLSGRQAATRKSGGRTVASSLSSSAAHPLAFSRMRSNSTSAAMKRPAPCQMFSAATVRRRSVVDHCPHRRVSFSVSGPELIGPSRMFEEVPPSPVGEKGSGSIAVPPALTESLGESSTGAKTPGTNAHSLHQRSWSVPPMTGLPPP